MAGRSGFEVAGLTLFGTGAYLCWFAIHYWRDADPWPTGPIRAMLTGGGLPTPSRVQRAKLTEYGTEPSLSDELGDLDAAQTAAAAPVSATAAPATSGTGAGGTGAGGSTGATVTATAVGDLPVIAVNEWVTGTDATEWATAILTALGAPTTSANVDSMIAWFNSEQGGGQNNPLNTTLQTSGSVGSVVSYSTGGTPAESDLTPPPMVSRRRCSSIDQSGYSNILADLKAGTGLIGLPTWLRSCRTGPVAGTPGPGPVCDQRPGRGRDSLMAHNGAEVAGLTLFGVGAYLAWFSIHYWRDADPWPTGPIRAVLTGGAMPTPSRVQRAKLTEYGTEPSLSDELGDLDAAQADATSAAAAGAGGGTAAAGAKGTAAAAVADALSYVGHCYLYGGPSNAADCWDCSSFMSWVLGHDEGMTLPGGSWATATANGTAHGDASDAFLSYGSAVTGAVEPGDLLVYGAEHIGMAVSATEMVSAEDEALGTGTTTPIPASVDGASLTVRRPAYASASTAPTGTAPTVTGTYTTAELEALWTSQGGSSATATTAACIAMAESTGNVNAKNPAPCSGSDNFAEGLWQICMPLNQASVPGGNAFDAASNAKAAIALSSNGTNWSAWSTESECV